MGGGQVNTEAATAQRIHRLIAFKAFPNCEMLGILCFLLKDIQACAKQEGKTKSSVSRTLLPEIQTFLLKGRRQFTAPFHTTPNISSGRKAGPATSGSYCNATWPGRSILSGFFLGQNTIMPKHRSSAAEAIGVTSYLCSLGQHSLSAPAHRVFMKMK